jgi:hypothetical protein
MCIHKELLFVCVIVGHREYHIGAASGAFCFRRGQAMMPRQRQRLGVDIHTCSLIAMPGTSRKAVLSSRDPSVKLK